MNKKLRGNKGEWSELYTFIQLLHKGSVYAENEQVERINDIFYPISKIIREEVNGQRVEYVIDKEQVNILVEAQEINSVSREELGRHAEKLFTKINNGNGSFSIDEISSFLDEIKVGKLKAPPSTTTDIMLQIHDPYTHYIREVGFSIKSEIGNSPTLLNAGETTNFIYSVSGITEQQMKEINKINSRTKIKDRIKMIKEFGGTLTYKGMNNNVFKWNLILLDSNMPQIIGEMLRCSYQDDIKDIKVLIEKLEQEDSQEYGGSSIYVYKLKKFLCACALGMKPGRTWDGIDEANGGYIIVKADGEILAYHIYNRNFFEQYLLDNTVLERGSTSRHKYLELYKEGDEIFIKLNLQIRFS